MIRAIILGSGAAPGVPSIYAGWGKCDPHNPKNRRQRFSIYVTDGMSQVLVDTSPDLRNQFLDNNIKTLDGVVYTHTHADHLHGIDDLRGVTRNLKGSLNFYAIEPYITQIKQRFPYVFANLEHHDITRKPELLPNIIEFNQEFFIRFIKVKPLEFSGHTIVTTGYCFNDGELVIVPDFKEIPPQTLEYLQNIDVNVLIMPLTTLEGSSYHASMDTVMEYTAKIGAKRVVLTHMATECDYDEITRITPDYVEPAYDNMLIEI